MSALETSRSILAAAGMRSFAVALTALLLPLYITSIGGGAVALGTAVGSGLAANALATIAVAAWGDRVGRRRSLIALAGLSALGLGAVALSTGAAAIAASAFFGLVNGLGKDRGAAHALEHSVLAAAVAEHERTRAFSRYALIQAFGAALGSLAAASPTALRGALALSPLAAYRWALVATAAVVALTIPIYLLFSDEAERRSAGGPWWRARVAPATRRRVAALGGLFAVDSLGGGFLASSLIAYWFFRRFELGGEVLGLIFFMARALNALSYLAVPWLARRIGLVRTMVFTHLPANVILCVVPFLPYAPLAIFGFLVREALAQMDVPARQSYVAAVTPVDDRTFALGVINLIRNAGWTFGPPLAGGAIQLLGLGSPLFLGAGLKIVYDLALYGAFRELRPPEERAGALEL